MSPRERRRMYARIGMQAKLKSGFVFAGKSQSRERARRCTLGVPCFMRRGERSGYAIEWRVCFVN